MTAILLLAAAPLAAAVVISLMMTRDMAVENVRQIALQKASNLQKGIQLLVGKDQAALLAVTADPDFAGDFLEADSERLYQKTVAIAESFGDGDTVLFVDSSGKQLARSDGKELGDVSSRDFFWQTMEGVSVISDIYEGKSAGDKVCTITSPVKDGNGDVVGMVQKSMKMTDLEEILEEMSDGVSEAAVTDRNGVVVADSSHTNEDVDMSGTEWYEAARNGKDDYFLEGSGAGRKLVVGVWDDLTGWSICCSTPYAEAMKDSRQSTLFIIVIGIFLLAIAGIIGAFVAGRMARRIEKISGIIDVLVGGDLSMPDIKIVDGSEIGRMGMAVNRMLENLNRVLRKADGDASLVAKSSADFNEVSSQSAQTLFQVAESATQLVLESGRINHYLTG